MDAKTMRRNAAEDIMILSLPGCWIKGDYFEISHLWLQNLSYHKPSLKSIHKKQQMIFLNSTSITANDALMDYELNNRNMLSLDLTLMGGRLGWLFGFSNLSSRAWGMISFWVETPFWVSSLPAHELHELPRRKMGHGRTRTKHGRLAAKNAKTREVGVIHHSSFYIKYSPIHHSLITTRFHSKLSQAQSIRSYQYIPHEKSPEPAQGMSHTASLAPQGVLPTINHCDINGCFGTGDIFNRIPPVPQRLYSLLLPVEPKEVAMIKNVRLIFDIEATVTEIISPDLIEKAKTSANDGKHVQIEQKM
ncbi:MAG: hypothetical protein NT166_21780, partial [Candidatus Aminicenantes bacterium]|nr:hypothetical protein [Candidatus Aminicenantes bacterium]